MKFKTTLVAASAIAATAAFAAPQQQGANPGVSAFPVYGATAFDGSDTLGYLHTYDLNLTLLKAHSKVAARSALNRPAFQLGGAVSGYVGHASFDSVSLSKLNLDSAKLGLNVDASQWVSGYIGMGVDNNNIATTSNFAVQQAFVTVGNLNKKPVFMSLGRMYVPFGRYANYMVTNTAPESLGQTRDDALDLGYVKGNLAIQGYLMKSENFKSSQSSTADADWDGGVNVDYNKALSGRIGGTFTLGAGYLSQMGDTNAFTNSGSSAVYAPRVGAINVHARLNARKFDVIASYVTALKKFNGNVYANSTSMNGKKPYAFDVQAAYKAKFKSTPVYIGAAYDMSHDASAVSGPSQIDGKLAKSAISGFVDANIWKNTALQLQYSNMKSYVGSKNINVLLAEMSMYF